MAIFLTLPFHTPCRPEVGLWDKVDSPKQAED